MKVIIAGSRTITPDQSDLDEAVEMIEITRGMETTEVVSGGAQGVDHAGELWATRLGIPIRRFVADWETYGKKAGVLRNARMAQYADALVLFWDGESPGSASMKQEAEKRGLPIHEVIVEGSE